jgi:hypothetical protein
MDGLRSSLGRSSPHPVPESDPPAPEPASPFFGASVGGLGDGDVLPPEPGAPVVGPPAGGEAVVLGLAGVVVGDVGVAGAVGVSVGTGGVEVGGAVVGATPREP